MWTRTFLAALMSLATQSVADGQRALSYADTLMGNTYRIDEIDLLATKRTASDASFVFIDPDGSAHIWQPGKNRMQQAYWSVIASRSLVWKKGGRYNSHPVARCLLDRRLGPEQELDCKSFDPQTVNKDAVLRRRLSVCFGPQTPGRKALKTQCHSDDAFFAATTDVIEEDVLDLQSGMVPCRLCRANATFADVRKTKGGF